MNVGKFKVKFDFKYEFISFIEIKLFFGYKIILNFNFGY